MELFTGHVNVPGKAVEMARRAEADGFDGISMGDTVTLAADPYVGLTAAAFAAPTLKLMVGVTNPITRHPALTAAAIVSVQIESKGRAVLGMGRGDSAVSKFGLKAASAKELEQSFIEIQGYLRGDKVHRDGKDSALEWLKAMDLPKVPIDVAATGPGVIAAAARQCERITFNLGGDGERIAQGIALARQARKDAGLPADGLSFGAYINVAPHPDIAVARQLVKGVTAVYTRFQAMPGHPSDQLNPRDAAVIKAVGANYNNAQHGRSDASHTAFMDDGYIDRFAAVGPADQCAEKLAGLMKLGLDRLVMVGLNPLAPPEHYAESKRLLREVVLPELRRAA
jgi:5,10-methylenetetrahydromethanopterin reductase